MFWQYSKIVVLNTSFFEKIMEICIINASYLSQICLIFASYMMQVWLWRRLNDTDFALNMYYYTCYWLDTRKTKVSGGGGVLILPFSVAELAKCEVSVGLLWGAGGNRDGDTLIHTNKLILPIVQRPSEVSSDPPVCTRPAANPPLLVPPLSPVQLPAPLAWLVSQANHDPTLIIHWEII